MSVAQKSSLSSVASDPLRNFKFSVVIQPPAASPLGNTAITLGFMTVDCPGINLDTIPYREGDMNTTSQKMVGQADFGPLTMSRGVTLGASQIQIDWLSQLFVVVQGSGTAAAGAEYRSDLYIYVLDHPSTGPSAPEKAGFHVYNAWPSAVAYQPLDAGANQLFVYQMTFAHEGFLAEVAAGTGTTDIAAF